MEATYSNDLAQKAGKGLQILEATFRIVTPMFIGGADQNPSDRVRPPSVKGALRFWWRAINWGRIRQQASSDTYALALLHAEETRLFGCAATNNSGGQGRFFVQIISQPSIDKLEQSWPTNNTGAGYMAFGILESKGGNGGSPIPHRKAIPENQNFVLQLIFKPDTTEADRASIREALLVWGRLGGLGSRSRRGHGSIALVELGGQNMCLDKQAYLDWVDAFIGQYAKVEEPPLTAFSAVSRRRDFDDAGKGRDALEGAGDIYKQHRKTLTKLTCEEKLGFGLPLEGCDQANRRASPLIFHVHALGTVKESIDQYQAICLYLPTSRFHYKKTDVDMTKVEQFIRG